MLTAGIKGTVGVKTKETQQQFDNTIENLTQSSETVDDVFNSLKDRVEEVLSGFKSLCGALDQAQFKMNGLQPTKQRKDELVTTGNQNQNQNTSLINQGVKGINTAESTALSVINGDLGGSIARAIKSAGNGIFSMGQSAQNEDLGSLVKFLGGAGIAIGATAMVGNALSKKYEEKLPTIDTLLTNFGGPVNKRTAGQNASVGQDLFSMVVSANEGTGLNNVDFANLVSSTGKNGITNVGKAIGIAKTGVDWSRFTGTDTSQAIDFMGMVERMGGNGTNAISSAYSAARASGLEKNQFGEFLDGVQSVIEKGIANGFVKSSKDVSESLAMLSRLSGNDPLWQGKYGAQRYQQMTSGMQNATSLSNVSQLLMYQAAKGVNNSAVQKYGVEAGSPDDWLNGMVMLESGDLGVKFMESLKQSVEGAYGGDRASRIKTYMEQFGLNYTGGIAVDKMMQNLDGMTDKQINDQMAKYKADPSMKSDNTRMQDVMSKLDGILTKMGADAFGLKIAGLETIERATTGIYNMLAPKMSKDIVGQMFDLNSISENADWESIQKDPRKLYKVQQVAYNLTPEQMSVANQYNYIQDLANGKITQDEFYSKIDSKSKDGSYWNLIRDSGFKYRNSTIDQLNWDGMDSATKERYFAGIKLSGLQLDRGDSYIDLNSNFDKTKEAIDYLITQINGKVSISIKEDN